jgi:hypothetical protein
MMERIAVASPRFQAKIGGVIALIATTAAFASFVRGSALSILGGLGWMTFLDQPLGYSLFPYIAVLGILWAASLILWLLMFGVNEQRWKEKASAALSTEYVFTERHAQI